MYSSDWKGEVSVLLVENGSRNALIKLSQIAGAQYRQVDSFVQTSP